MDYEYQLPILQTKLTVEFHCGASLHISFKAALSVMETWTVVKKKKERCVRISFDVSAKLCYALIGMVSYETCDEYQLHRKIVCPAEPP